MIRHLTDWLNLGMTAGMTICLWLLPANTLASASGGLVSSTTWRALAIGVCVLLLLLNGWHLARTWFGGRLRERLRLAAPDGANLLAPDALEDLFLRQLKEHPDVCHPRVTLEVKAEQGVALHIRLGLNNPVDVIQQLERVKAEIRERFLRMLPSGVNLEIFAEVVEFTASPTPAPRPEKVQDEFNGPVYSDDAEQNESNA